MAGKKSKVFTFVSVWVVVLIAVLGFATTVAMAGDVQALAYDHVYLQKLTHAPQNHFAANQRFFFTFTPASDDYGTGTTTAETPAAGNVESAQDDYLVATADSTSSALGTLLSAGTEYTRTGQSGLVMQVGEDYSRENLEGSVFIPLVTEFPHAGVYAYTVTENPSVEGQAIDAVTYSQAQYIMRVYVTNSELESATSGSTTTAVYPTVTIERITTDDGKTPQSSEGIGSATYEEADNLSDQVGKVDPYSLTNVIRSESEATAEFKFKNTLPGDGTGSANEDYKVDANTTYSACPPDIFKSAYAKGFEFYNDYNKSANTKLTFTKKVDGDYGDKATQYFPFEMDIQLAEEHITLSNDYVEKHSGTSRLDYYKTITDAFTTAFTSDLGLSADDYSLEWRLYNSTGAEVEAEYPQLAATAGQSLQLHMTFKAKHDDTFTVSNVLPESSGYAVKETGLSNSPYTPSATYYQVVTSTENKDSETGVEKAGPDEDGLYTYTTSAKAGDYTDGSDSYEVKNWDSSAGLPTKVFNQSSVTITNTYTDAVTPTGLFIANAPYIILVGAPVAALAVWFVRRRQNAKQA